MQLTLNAEHPVTVRNLEKILWPAAGITKGDFVHYLVDVAPAMLPHLSNRPLTTVRYPNGIEGHSFYQKNAPKDTPEWISIYEDRAGSGKSVIRYIQVEDTAGLIWLGNQACIELHPWYSTATRPDHPTNLAFDLDPSVPGWELVVEVALRLHSLLESLHLPSYPKTSGATGLQIFVPIRVGFTYEDTRRITHFIARYMESMMPHAITLERRVNARGNKLYFDYLQHAPRRTLVAPYSPRPVPLAQVSAPLTWQELERGARPEDFTIHSMPSRLRQLGDLFSPMTGPGVDLSPLLQFIERSERP